MSHTECQRVAKLTSSQTMLWVYTECDQCGDRIKLSLNAGAIYSAAVSKFKVNVKVLCCSLWNLSKQCDIIVCHILFISMIRPTTYCTKLTFNHNIKQLLSK